MSRGLSVVRAVSQAKHVPWSEQKINYTIDSENRLVRAQSGKVITEQALREYVESLRSNPEFSPSLSEIMDLRAAEKIEMNGNERINVADHIDPFSPSSKRAFVVRNAIQSHEARMHGILRMVGDNLRSFRSTTEAETWILSANDK